MKLNELGGKNSYGIIPGSRRNMQAILFVSQLVGALSPVKPQRITSGLNTNFTPCDSFYKSSYQKSCFFVLFLKSIYILRALNTGTCIQQSDLFYSAGLHRNRCQPQLTQENFSKSFGKNTGEWTGRVKISKEEIPGSKRTKHGYMMTYARL